MNPIFNKAIHDIDVPGQCAKAPHCGLFALAMLLGESIGSAAERYQEVTPKRANWKGRTHRKHLLKAIKAAGVLIQFVGDGNGQTVGRYFSKQCVSPNDWYIVWLSGHVVTVNSDLIRDQYSIDKVGDLSLKNNRKRIKYAIKILGMRNSRAAMVA